MPHAVTASLLDGKAGFIHGCLNSPGRLKAGASPLEDRTEPHTAVLHSREPWEGSGLVPTCWREGNRCFFFNIYIEIAISESTYCIYFILLLLYAQGSIDFKVGIVY